MQDIVLKDGVLRFRANEIVRALLNETPMKLNELAAKSFPQKDWEQFYQLIGYSISGYHELSNVSDESALAATEAARLAGFVETVEAGGCRDLKCQIHAGAEKEK